MSAPTDAEEILMDLFETNRKYQKFLDALKGTPPMERPDVIDLITISYKLKSLYDKACVAGYTYTQRWRRRRK